MEFFQSHLNGLPSVKVGGDVVSIRYNGFTISAEIHCAGSVLNIYRINQGKFRRTSLDCFGDLFKVLMEYIEAKDTGIFPDYERIPSQFQISLGYYNPDICSLEDVFDYDVKRWIDSNRGEIEDVFNEITSILEGE